MSASIREILRAARVSRPRVLLREAARLPLVVEATGLLAGLPRIELASLTGPTTVTASLSPAESRHEWSLGAGEQLVIQALVQARGVRTAFEIGTFNGGTTRVLAESVPEDGKVVTLDLPPAAFDQSQRPHGVTGQGVGRAYADSSAAHKVVQLLQDSLRFDATEYSGQFDLVLVDGGHEFEHGVADTRSALQLVKPGGMILWDDFEPYWHGLVRGICQEMAGRALGRLTGSSLGVYLAPEPTVSDAVGHPGTTAPVR